MTKKQPAAKKKIAEDFLNLTEKGEVDKAFELYITDSFKHHSPRFKGDRETIKAVIEKTAKRFPKLQSKRYAILEDGNFVSIHSHIRPEPHAKNAGLSYIHIFRFDGNKIAELWDFGQPIPTEIANENGAF